MPDTPNDHDDQDENQIDRLLRDAGARLRAATYTSPLAIEPTGPRRTGRRWIVPVAIVAATAAAVVAAVWIAGPATETVRQAPADTGLVSTPDSAVDSLPAVAPVDSSPPTETAEPESTEPPIAPEPGQPAVTITEADFDRAGGMCVRLVAGTDSADACLTNRQLQDIPTWTVAFAEQAFEVALGRLDPEGISVTPTHVVCASAPSALTQARWLTTSCEPDQFFWFVAAPEVPGGESTTYVVPPRTGAAIALEPTESSLPDGFVAYRADYEEFGTNIRCLLVASFPDPWREACVHGSDLPRMLVPAGGSVFLVEPGPEVASVDVQDIAELSVPIAGCTSPVLEMAAPLDSSVMISGLVCADDSAMITVPPVFLRHGPPDGLGYVLDRAADGTWSTSGGGTSFTCPHDSIQSACEALGVDDDSDLMAAPLPVPPWELIDGRELDLDPVEVTAEVREVTGGAVIPDEIAASVIARYDDRSPGDGRDPVVESFDALGLVVVELTLLDDSTTQARYAVWYRPTDSGELRVERAFRIYVCGRGIAAPDMCV